jgi:hypothetical protein
MVLDASPGVPAAGYRPLAVHFTDASAAASPLYTCPPNRRALVTIPNIANTNAASRTFRALLNGTVVLLWTLPANQYLTTELMWLLNAGDTFEVTATGSDVSGQLGVKEITAAGTTDDLVAATVTSVVGDVTVYTCPAGYVATLLDDYGELTPGQIVNDTGGSVHASLKLAPAGGGAQVPIGGFSTGYPTVSPTLLSDATTTMLWGRYVYLNAGDSLVLSSDAAGAVAHIIWRLASV